MKNSNTSVTIVTYTKYTETSRLRIDHYHNYSGNFSMGPISRFTCVRALWLYICFICISVTLDCHCLAPNAIKSTRVLLVYSTFRLIRPNCESNNCDNQPVLYTIHPKLLCESNDCKLWKKLTIGYH